MKWIESSGGPLVLLPETKLEHWNGFRGEDYKRACGVANEVGLISFADREVLVLGDEPLSTTWMTDDEGGVFAQWVYADSEESALAALDARHTAHFGDAGIRLAIDGAYCLIDAADPGNALKAGSLHIRLRSGTYSVGTAILDDGPDVRMRLHKLTRLVVV